jgi:hypothetical protein
MFTTEKASKVSIIPFGVLASFVHSRVDPVLSLPQDDPEAMPNPLCSWSFMSGVDMAGNGGASKKLISIGFSLVTVSPSSHDRKKWIWYGSIHWVRATVPDAPRPIERATDSDIGQVKVNRCV